MPKDRITKLQQGYGFVELRTSDDAEYVKQIYSGLRLYNKPLKISRATQDDNNSSKSNGSGNIGNNNTNGSINSSFIGIGAILYIGNLDELVDEKLLYETFSNFGNLISNPIIERDNLTGKSKNFGFISYDSFESSDKAIKEMNGKLILNKQIKLDYAFKSNGKNREKHGDKSERLLAEKAKLNNFNLKNSNSSSQRTGNNNHNKHNNNNNNNNNNSFQHIRLG
ncbi:unnamed protein product [[Candida] boidinii]|uniref:Unnamed protein product n=1 Tax=Candida boidinii TaxID=5477 RepID=A0ACB5THF0_CANBO|nr:unnamed protein product [[Candida] boidinii]